MRADADGVSTDALCVWLGTLASWRQGFIMRLVERFGSVGEILGHPPQDIVRHATRRARGAGASGRASKSGGRSSTGPIADEASDARRFAETLAAGPEACALAARRRPAGDSVIAWCDPLYPAQLRKLPDPPLCLFVRGPSRELVEARLAALALVPSIAVVGTRAPSPYGEDMARMLGRDLTVAGLIVVSGLAFGIDAVAQSAALEAPGGSDRPATVAVLGCGADVAYPRQNTRLHAQVAARGLVVSEFTWGVRARRWRFPARNRVMAALARGVVVVEGAERSGARITGGFAVDLGREVFGVPGEAGHRLSAAPHLFLRDGAKLCESAADVIRGIAAGAPAGPDADRGSSALLAEDAVILDHGEGAVRKVLRALETGAMTVDEVSRRCGIPASKAAAAASELEVEGLARRTDGGRYRLQRR